MAKVFKQLQYHWHRWGIDREFKRNVNQAATSTFFQSFVDMNGAMKRGGDAYIRYAVARRVKMDKLIAEYQQYFDHPLDYRGASELI